MKRVFFLFVGALLMLTALPGAVEPALARTQPALGRDQVVIGSINYVENLNPVLAGGALERVVLATMFTADVERDDLWRPFPQGVEYLPRLDDGTWRMEGQRMTLLWNLRPRTWQDGRPVTCGDYVFSHAVARNPAVPVASDRAITNKIAGVECPKGAGGTEVRVVWNERFAHANLQVTEFGALPRHRLEAAYRRNPSRLREAAFGTQAATTLGDGAYRVVEWRRGDPQSITVAAVANHPIFGTPKINRITWRYFVGPALSEAMLSGEIDATSVVGIVNVDRGLQLERQAAGRFRVLFVPALAFEHVDFNLDNPLLQDLRVRRAIAHGINRTQITQQLFGGRQPVAHSYLPTRHPGYTEHVQRYPYDLSLARVLLKEAGFTPGPDGILRNAAGQRMTLELNTTLGIRYREQVAQLLQAQLAQVGIEVVVRNVPGRVLVELTGRRKFTMAMYSWILSPESDCNLLYTSADIPGEANHWSGQNHPGYRNPEMDRLCSSASGEIDPDRRRALLQESTRLFARDLPALPLYFRGAIVGVKNGLENYRPGVSSALEAWNAHEWYWR